jgi:hypothetical protein
MPIRLTESRLRSIIREEMNALTRRKTAVAKRTLKEGLADYDDYDDPEIAAVMYEALELTLNGSGTATLEQSLGRRVAEPGNFHAPKVALDGKLLRLLETVPELARASGFMGLLKQEVAEHSRHDPMGAFFSKKDSGELVMMIIGAGRGDESVTRLVPAAKSAGLRCDPIEDLDY